MTTARRILTAMALPLVLAGCGASTSSITTGSLFGGSAAPAAPAAVAETPGMRATQVAAVSARAAKCGYNFDPSRLKSSYLAHEMGQGASAQDMAKIEREFDTIRVKTAAAIAADPEYCSESKTRVIKADLTRHMAGDFSSPEANRKVVDERLLSSGPRTREVLNPDFLHDKYASKTKRVEE